jgi:hypothetical protein
MPEPISITTGVLSILSVCVKVGYELMVFHNNTKIVDEAVGGLGKDVESFKQTLEAVRETLEQTDGDSYAQQTGHLGSHWRNIQQALESGEMTLLKLETVLQKVNKEVSFLNASRKQLRLQAVSDRIAIFRSQIQCSRDVLNTSLQSFI